MTGQPSTEGFLTPAGVFTSGIEGPACDHAGNVYAVNYARQGTIGRVAPDGRHDLFVDLPAGSTGCGIRFDRSGTVMFVADHTGHHVLRVTVTTRAVDVFIHEPRMHQPNDLALDSDGTLFASDPDWTAATGQLWRIGADGTITLLEADMGTTNGIEVDQTRRLLYVNETRQRRIWAYDLTAPALASSKRLFATFADHGLDGMRCDTNGNLYVTRPGAGAVAVLRPDGVIDRTVHLPGLQCTNLCFGGGDGRTCYVTLADRGTLAAFRAPTPGQEWQLWQPG